MGRYGFRSDWARPCPGPALAGGLGFTGGVAGGVANGVIGSAIGQGIVNGKIDPGSLVTAGILGGLGAWFDDMVAGGEIVREGGAITNATDNAIWGMSDMLGVDYETAAGIMEGMISGAITGDSLEDIIKGAVTGWGGAKINDWVTDYFGSAGVDVSNWFREGETNIPSEALGTIAEGAFKAAVAGGMSDGDALSLVLDYFNEGGSLDFIWPDGVDMSWMEGVAGKLPDWEWPEWAIAVGIPGIEFPDVNLPDVDIDIDVPNPCGEGTEWSDVLQDCVPIQNPCGEGLIWDADLGECVPELPDVLECMEGFQWDEGLQECVPIPNPCGEGLIWDADLGQCVPELPDVIECMEGFEWDDVLEECVPIQNPCGDGLIWDADLGECVPDVIECMEGFQWDEGLRECVPIENPCGDGLIWDADLGECVPELPDVIECMEGFEWDDLLGKCVEIDIKCPEGWDVDEDGVCIEPPKPCSDGYSWDPDLGECIPDRKPCPEGQERNAFGICVEPRNDCPAGFEKNEDGECVEIPDVNTGVDLPPIEVPTGGGGMFNTSWTDLQWNTPQYHGPKKAQLTSYDTIMNSLKRDKGMFS